MKYGKIEHLEARKVWKNELAFSKWLRGNFEILSEELGIVAEELETEKPVGRMSCDITGKEITSEIPIVVENQFGPSNHDHLGKVVTYSAGLNAGIVVWIAESFKDEHLSGLEWLNKSTDKDISFFGIQLKILRIDDSNPAPVFQIVSQPNEWQRALRIKGLSDLNVAYIEYFGRLIDKIREEAPSFSSVRKPLPQNWLAVGVGKSGVSLNFVFSKDGRYRVELFISPGGIEKTEWIYKALSKQKSEIELELTNLDWELLNKSARIATYYGPPVDVLSVLQDSKKLSQILEWSLKMGQKMKKVFEPRLKALQSTL